MLAHRLRGMWQGDQQLLLEGLATLEAYSEAAQLNREEHQHMIDQLRKEGAKAKAAKGGEQSTGESPACTPEQIAQCEQRDAPAARKTSVPIRRPGLTETTRALDGITTLISVFGHGARLEAMTRETACAVLASYLLVYVDDIPKRGKAPALSRIPWSYGSEKLGDGGTQSSFVSLPSGRWQLHGLLDNEEQEALLRLAIHAWAALGVDDLLEVAAEGRTAKGRSARAKAALGKRQQKRRPGRPPKHEFESGEAAEVVKAWEAWKAMYPSASHRDLESDRGWKENRIQAAQRRVRDARR
jgi:hypothetical protein